MNQIQEIAHTRLHEIAAARERIERKINDLPDDQRVPQWQARLAEYAVSVKALKLELKTGVAVKIKDAKQQALIVAIADGEAVPAPTEGVTVNVPAGELTMEGK